MKRFFKHLRNFMIILGALLIVGGFVEYFSISQPVTKFIPNTFVNNVEISNLDIKGARNKVTNYFLSNYSFIIYEDKKAIDEIDLSKLELTTNISKELDKVLKEQHKSFFFSHFINNYYETTICVEKVELSDKFINSLNIVKRTDYIKTENARIDTESNDYKIIPEVYGTKVNSYVLVDAIRKCLKNGIYELDVKDIDAYELPTILSTDESLQEYMNAYKKYMELEITYDFSDRSEKISEDDLKTFFTLNEDLSLDFHDDKIMKYIENLASKYNTFGKEREFQSTEKGLIKVSGGDYGYSISQNKEMEQLKQDILACKDIRREPMYLYEGYIRDENDIGDNYVEIDLDAQKLWLYKYGVAVLTTDIVSGCENDGNSTPTGVYCLTYKELDATLNGANYATPVKYWMPFNKNIGMHDATWRKKFGGSIYKTDGSHGCINMPLDAAKKVYESIEKGMPIIVYNKDNEVLKDVEEENKEIKETEPEEKDSKAKTENKKDSKTENKEKTTDTKEKDTKADTTTKNTKTTTNNVDTKNKEN